MILHRIVFLINLEEKNKNINDVIAKINNMIKKM